MVGLNSSPVASAGELAFQLKTPSGGSSSRQEDDSRSSDDEEESEEDKDGLEEPAEPTGETGTDPGDFIPGIDGKDTDGVKFSLGDYEGKVLMIDFWGDW